MQLASHELHDLTELTMGCYNTIGCMASFIQQAQDPEPSCTNAIMWMKSVFYIRRRTF